MKSFAPYASELEAYVETSLTSPMSPSAPRNFEGLDPYEALRNLVPVDELRALGVFFTSAELARLLWKPALPTLTPDSIVVDPACGAGDLLFEAADYLAGTTQPEGKLSSQIRGSDLEDLFLRTARARLRHKYSGTQGREDFLHFYKKDFLRDTSSIEEATHVVMNPPFFPTQAPEECNWAAGQVNSASIFVMRALESMKPGARMLAILPDVLRSGTRYEKWRTELSNLTTINRIDPVGQFDTETDIHVFLLELVIGRDHTDNRPGTVWKNHQNPNQQTVAGKFEVKVGPVVPHRDPHAGANVPFLTARNVHHPIGVQEMRQFSGRLDKGPMVLVSRTSRPGQDPRARSTLWEDDQPSAVENHLILLKPIDGKIETCKKLIRILSHPQTTTFLDNRIRCRHLTVGAVREIPWIDEDTE